MRTAPVVLALIFVGCATTEQAQLDSEVRAVVKEGMPTVQAISSLESLRFVCTEGRAGAKNEKELFECTRSQQNLWPPFGCIHRVWFESREPANSTAKLDVWRPSCAGM